MKTVFSERGQGLVEYSLVLVLVSVVAIIAMNALGVNITGLFTKVNSELDGISQIVNFI